MDQLKRIRERANRSAEKTASIGSALQSGWKGVKGVAGGAKDMALDATKSGREFAVGAPFVGVGVNEMTGRPITASDISSATGGGDTSDNSRMSRVKKLRRRRRRRG